MRQVSHSEISTYLDCQKKWELQYLKGIKIDNVHFQFGSMGHKVLETRVIPDESLYVELKEAFGITSWNNYFTPILEELDERLKDYEILSREYKIETEELKGVIDVVLKNKNNGRYLILDYKFSNTDKGAEDIWLDEQMYIYAITYCQQNNIDLENMDIGYVSIPKSEMNNPRILKNGQLSKDKAQNVTYKKYLEAIHKLNLNEEDYADFLLEIKDRQLINITISSINSEMAVRILNNINNVIKDMDKGYVLEKCTFMCKKCEYMQYCKRKNS